jgi:hypothetical protein
MVIVLGQLFYFLLHFRLNPQKSKQSNPAVYIFEWLFVPGPGRRAQLIPDYIVNASLLLTFPFVLFFTFMSIKLFLAPHAGAIPPDSRLAPEAGIKFFQIFGPVIVFIYTTVLTISAAYLVKEHGLPFKTSKTSDGQPQGSAYIFEETDGSYNVQSGPNFFAISAIFMVLFASFFILFMVKMLSSQ